MEEQTNQPMDEERQVDEIFRNSLGNAGIEPPGSVWKTIRRRLLWKELARFNFTNVSRAALIGGGAGIILLSALVYFALKPEKEIPGKPAISQETSWPSVTGSIPVTAGKTAESNLTSVKPVPEKTGPAVNPSKEQVSHPSRIVSQPLAQAGTIHSGTAASSEKTGGTLSNVTEPVISNTNSVTSVSSSISGTGLDRLQLLESPLFEGFTMTGPVPQMVMQDIRPIQPLAGSQKIPQHFSAGFSIAPEVTFYRTDHSYSMFDIYGDINFTYYFGKFYFRPGIGLGYYYDRSTGTVDFKSNDSTGFYYEVVSYTVSGNQIIYNTIQKTIYDSITHTHTEILQNRYLCLQIPLILGVKAFESRNFRIGVQLGPVISFLIGKKEPVPDGVFPESRILRIQNSSKERVLTNWQIWAGLNFEYMPGKNIGISFSPEFRYFLNPVINNELNHGFHPWSTGINIGVSYHFGYKNQQP